MLLLGRVKFFRPDLGYGFIEMPPDCEHTKGRDVFLQISYRYFLGVKEGEAAFYELAKGPSPAAGDLVVFWLGDIGKGPIAVHWAPLSELGRRRVSNLPDPASIPPLRTRNLAVL